MYAAAARLGISAAAVDEMELWQLGAALGLTTDQEGRPQGANSASALPREYLEERARAVAEGRPLPDPPLILKGGQPPSTREFFEQVPRVAHS